MMPTQRNKMTQNILARLRSKGTPGVPVPDRLDSGEVQAAGEEMAMQRARQATGSPVESSLKNFYDEQKRKKPMLEDDELPEDVY